MAAFRNGDSVRVRQTSQWGTVIDVIAGNVTDAVLVEWAQAPNQRLSWEPSSRLELPETSTTT